MQSPYSCRLCEHFDEHKRGTRCQFYDTCKAGRPLASSPACFSPAYSRPGVPLTLSRKR